MGVRATTEDVLRFCVPARSRDCRAHFVQGRLLASDSLLLSLPAIAVAETGNVSVTVARPLRIFTVFRFPAHSMEQTGGQYIACFTQCPATVNRKHCIRMQYKEMYLPKSRENEQKTNTLCSGLVTERNTRHTPTVLCL